MSVTKNALSRYIILDELLSDHHHKYSMGDLHEKCNERLRAQELPEVTKRCIEKDINSLEFAPFYAEIDKQTVDGKRRYCYADKHFSIFRKELKEEERLLLGEFLNTLGQFEGLAHFDWIEGFRLGLHVEERPKIISFSNNPYLLGSNLLGTLFDYMSNKVVIRLSYHTFSDASVRSIEFHAYLLKQYNDRWYLLGAADSDNKILSFPLDRIDDVEPLPEKKYKVCSQDLQERFEDIVGVTLYEDREVEHILCWVSDSSKGYVETKPIHGSYTPLKGDKEQQLRSEFPQLEGGMFFTLDCINNWELIRELCSYGKDLIVLRSSGMVADEVRKRVVEMAEQYRRIGNNK